jgi:hypothetical protein
MLVQHELTAIEARRFLQALPRTRSRALAWATPAGKGLRLASVPSQAGVCLAGAERLRLLEKLVPFARALRIYGPIAGGDGAATPSAWELVLDGARVIFVASPEIYRGFSGEGAVLADLANADEEVVDAVADELEGDPAIDAALLAQTLETTRSRVNSALNALGAAGRVGFDLGSDAFFHRELPFDRSALEAMHPRLLGAAQLVEQKAVRLDGDGAVVRSDDVEYQVRFTPEGPRCTCAWFARHRHERGPCKHILAAEYARRGSLVT